MSAPEMSLPEHQLDTPVAFLIFNRPDTTRRVFEAIRAARPRHLLVVADGPRAGRAGEAERCSEARRVIEGVDWDCRVETNYADSNMGCRRRITSGLDWIFQQVEEAIILEDDCLPHPSFFRFCEELLERYRHEPRVAQITGVNFQFGQRKFASSYYYSRYNHIWGWASWRRAWELHDSEMSDWPDYRDRELLNNTLPTRREVRYWTDVLNQVHSGEIDTWDCQWTLSCWMHGLLTVTPAVNLVSNLGFGPGATHTPVPNRYAEMKTEPVEFPLVHPDLIAADPVADAYTGKTFYREYSFLRRLVAALKGQIPLFKKRA